MLIDTPEQFFEAFYPEGFESVNSKIFPDLKIGLNKISSQFRQI